MSIESDASKWKSNVSRILEVDPEGILLTETVKKYFDEVAAVFKKGTFDAENTKKQLKVLRGRNTRLSGKPIAVELSSFVNITERYATKTEEAFTSFVKALSSNARISSNGNSTRTSSRQHQAQSSRQKPLPDPPDALDSIISELDNLADESPSRTPPPPRISTNMQFVIFSIWFLISGLVIYNVFYDSSVSTFGYIVICMISAAPLAGSMILATYNDDETFDSLGGKIVGIGFVGLIVGAVVSVVDFFFISKGFVDFFCDLIEIGFGFFAVPSFFFMKLINICFMNE